MTVIDVKGDVVANMYSDFYDFYGMDCVYPKKIQEAIHNNDDGDVGDIVLNIASNGGDVFAASEIYTMLRNSGRRVVVNVQGLAASAASVIAMAGDVVKISPTAQMMIHKASQTTNGNSDDLRHQANVLDSVDSSIVNAYKIKTGLDESEIIQLMQNETWMNAQEAVDKGFADEIMFVNEDDELVTNNIHNLPSKQAINKFLNMLAKDKPAQPKEKPVKSLRERKLAILLGK